MDKRRLTRIVRIPEGRVTVDPTGKLNGRGGYLCDNIDCWRKAIESQALDRALKTDVSEPEKQDLAAFMPEAHD
jgi:predicted RNA-binding protein YlxR (DUF448 family)